jgi:Protein of unknown function (DUF2933)
VTIHIGRNALTFIGLGALGGAALAFIAGVPLTTILLFGLVLACPLMMLSMHGGHQEGGQLNILEDRLDGKKYPPGVQ